MPKIISSTTLRNEYNEVSREAHQSQEPIFVTKNGAGDLAVMSMETFELLSRRAELLEKLAIGHADVLAGRTVNAREALGRLREGLAS
jgi:prevent-host-death family protein